MKDEEKIKGKSERRDSSSTGKTCALFCLKCVRQWHELHLCYYKWQVKFTCTQTSLQVSIARILLPYMRCLCVSCEEVTLHLKTSPTSALGLVSPLSSSFLAWATCEIKVRNKGKPSANKLSSVKQQSASVVKVTLLLLTFVQTTVKTPNTKRDTKGKADEEEGGSGNDVQ